VSRTLAHIKNCWANLRDVHSQTTPSSHLSKLWACWYSGMEARLNTARWSAVSCSLAARQQPMRAEQGFEPGRLNRI
jgi:hypothetical protein